MCRLTVILSFVSGLVYVSDVQAAYLQVSPVTLDLSEPIRNSSVSIHNDGDEASNIQIRVFKWTQVDGKDKLVPSTDVMVSPPATKMQPNSSYTIRIVHRNTPSKVIEESYRLWIDELPDSNVRRRNAAINFVTRYSLPIFFSPSSASSDLQWKVQRQGKQLIVEATNKGTRHAKLANLAVATGGARVSFGTGLNGYVLPGSTMRWTTDAGAIQAGSQVKITATGDDYAVNHAASVSGR